MVVMDGRELLDAWLAVRSDPAGKKPFLKPAGPVQATTVWTQWLEFLGHENWQDADPAAVSRFIVQLEPRSKGPDLKRKSEKARLLALKREALPRRSSVSPATQRRYWRIIRDLYAYAVQLGLLESNPATEDNKPAESERILSTTVEAKWSRLLKALPEGDNFRDRRNRALLLLMMRWALTKNELAGLNLQHVRTTPASTPNTSDVDMFDLPAGPLLPLPVGQSYVLTVGTKTVRRIVLDEESSRALEKWLEVRTAGMMDAQDQSATLLTVELEGQPLTRRSLYNICRAHIVDALKGEFSHLLGPNTLRNTCIALWVKDGVPTEEIKRRCAFADAGFLTRLPPKREASPPPGTHANQ